MKIFCSLLLLYVMMAVSWSLDPEEEEYCGTTTPGYGCLDVYDPVCGSNGITYPNACELGRVPGVTVKHVGMCGTDM